MPETEIHDFPHPQELAWRSSTHVKPQRSSEDLKKAILKIGMLVILVVLFKQFLLAAVIVAFAFVLYLVASFEPEEVEHTIDRNGITSGGKTHIWEDLDYFFFDTLHGRDVLKVVTYHNFPPQISMFLSEKVSKEEVRFLMEDYIPFRSTPGKPALDRAIHFIARFFYLD